MSDLERLVSSMWASVGLPSVYTLTREPDFNWGDYVRVRPKRPPPRRRKRRSAKIMRRRRANYAARKARLITRRAA